MYPADEASNNSENYNTAIQRLSGKKDDLYSKVWWDKD